MIRNSSRSRAQLNLETLEQRNLLSGTPVYEREPNYSPATATGFSLSPGGEVELRGISRGSIDLDYFKFTANQGGTLRISAATTNANMPRIEIRNAEMVLGATAPVAGVNTFSLGLTKGRTYFLSTRSINWKSSGYKVTLSLSAPDTEVPPVRLAKLAHTTNISRWFRYPDEETDNHFQNYIPASELAAMRGMGFTAVRLAIRPYYLFNRSQPSNLVNTRMLGHVDHAVQSILDAGMAVIIDMHDEEDSWGEKEKTWMETDATYRENFKAFWLRLSKHFRAFDADSVFLEVFNEPRFYNNPDAWYPIQAKLVEVIRAGAPQHTILATGPVWGGIYGILRDGQQNEMQPLSDRNIIYQFHYYEPFPFTHQGASWDQALSQLHNIPYPATPQQIQQIIHSTNNQDVRDLLSPFLATGWNATTIRNQFGQMADWGQRHDVPIFLGEFGAVNDAPKTDRLTYLADVVAAANAYDFGWALWSYDEYMGLDRHLDANGKAILDTDTIRALGLQA